MSLKNRRNAADFKKTIEEALSGHKSRSNDDYNMALKTACEKFDEMHPKESQPTWLKYCIRIRQTKNQNGNWVFKVVLKNKFKLDPDLYWIWDDTGFSHLIHIDPLTEKRSYVICDGGAPAETETIFEVEVDDKGSAIVLTDTNLDLLDGANYQLNIEYSGEF